LDLAADCEAAARAAGREIQVVTRRADISVAAEREDLAGFAKAAFGHLDLLVNNAGIAPAVRADLLEVTEESLDRLLDTNLKGTFLLTQRLAKWMLARRPPSGAKIVFISSISAFTASVNRGDYCVSKAGVAMLVKLFAARLAEHGIGVFEVRPGIIATDMTGPVKAKYDALIAGGLTPIRRWGTPEDVGRAVAAIAEDAFPFSTGEVIHVDGGFHLRTL
jgi:NAD(P)-dependent dehydrogenase (short-subunit alcohol dehydrogenase family)